MAIAFSMSIFWALQHLLWVARGTFFPEQTQTVRLWKESVSTASWLVPGSKRQAAAGASVYGSVSMGLHVFCGTKKNWCCHHVSLKQSCLPRKVLFPRPRRSQATGDGFIRTARGQVQPGLSPPALSPSASHTCSISRLFGLLFPHSQLLCSCFFFSADTKISREQLNGSWLVHLCAFVLDGKISLYTDWGVWVLYEAGSVNFPSSDPNAFNLNDRLCNPIFTDHSRSKKYCSKNTGS